MLSFALSNGGVRMDIHRPKAAHSIREFVIEIGTIICGILIALGLEQAVDAVHRGSEVQEAREALREELRDNTSFLIFGVEEDKCLLPKLDALSAWARGGPKPNPLKTHLAEYETGTWDTVKLSAVPLMPLRERRALTTLYDGLATEKSVVDIQRSSALILIGTLERQRLNEADANRVLDAAATGRMLTKIHIGNATSILRVAEALGVKPQPLTPTQASEIAGLCNPATAEPQVQSR
jgi:hypothetical protein